jgi:UDP-3-O-[3-hydroxymyristoyl] glucosamine N-acyltransferase
LADPRFFKNHGPFRLADLCERIGARLGPGVDGTIIIHDVAPLESGGPDRLVYAQGGAHRRSQQELLGRLAGGACLVGERDIAMVPPHIAVLIAAEPRRAHALAAQAFYPRDSGSGQHHPTAQVDPSAKVGTNVDLGAYAVVGPRAEIGDGSIISPGVVIGDGVLIGRQAWIGANASVAYGLIGDRVTLHPGVRIGQDGFGVVPGPKGFTRVPQLGRVIIQDDVDIGANTCVDRGAGGDTVIGEGTWIDNLVQIGHNVRVGRYCVIAAEVGISGSVTIGDFVAIGGQAAFADHVNVASGAQVGAKAGVMRDVGPGQRVLGSPAQPARQFFRTIAWLNRMVSGDKSEAE